MEVFSLLKAIENSRQFLLLRTDIFYRKQLSGAPVQTTKNRILSPPKFKIAAELKRIKEISSMPKLYFQMCRANCSVSS